MKLDMETLKKNRFWVLLCVAGPLIFFGLICLATAVPSAIQKRKTEVENKLSGLTRLSNAKSDKWVKVAEKRAGEHKKLEEIVWKDAFLGQNFLFTWPKKIEDDYQFEKGMFALEIKATDKAPETPQTPAGEPSTPPVTPDGKTGTGTGAEQKPKTKGQGTEEKPKKDNSPIKTISGTIKERKSEWILLEVQGKPEPLKIYRTKDVKVSRSADGKDQTSNKFNLLQLNDHAEVTYQIGKYFGDPMTVPELQQYKLAYGSQLREILDSVRPLKADGTGLVQFKDWKYDPDPLELPPVNASFFHRVDWVNKIDYPTSQEAWISQEDLWIQREIYRLIRKANDYTAEFLCDAGYNRSGSDWFLYNHDDWDLHVQLAKVGQETKPSKLNVKLVNRANYTRLLYDMKLFVKVDPSNTQKNTYVSMTLPKKPAESDPAAEVYVKANQTFTHQVDIPANVNPVGVFYVAHQTEEKDKNDKFIFAQFKPQGGYSGNHYYFSNPHWRLKLKFDKDAKDKKGNPLYKVFVDITNRASYPKRVDVEFKIKIHNNPRVSEERSWATVRVQNKPIHPDGIARINGGKSLTLRLPEGAKKPTGIFGVEQILTWEYAAIKRIDDIRIGNGQSFGGEAAAAGGDGMPPGGRGPAGAGGPGGGGAAGTAPSSGVPAHSHRTFPKGVKPLKEEAEDTSAPAENQGDPAPGGGLGGVPGAGAAPSKKGMTPHGLQKNRYVEITPQSRKVPVAVVLIVDQDQVGRVVAAFTNSKMRFLTNQVLLNRYPHSIRPEIETKKAAGSGTGDLPPGGQGDGPPGAPGAGGAGDGFFPGGGGGSPTPGAGGGGYNPDGQYTVPSTIRYGDDRITNMEVVMYGYVTLYQRYPTKPGTVTGGTE